MSELKTPNQIREELSELIHEAVPEPNAARRQALLVMADHWSAILRRRLGGAKSSSGPVSQRNDDQA